MALAPSSVLFGVPSSLLRKASTADWSLTSMFSLIRAGAILSLTLATALVTPEVSRQSLAFALLSSVLLMLTLASPLALVSVAELTCLVRAGRCAGWHNGAVQAGLGDDVDLDGGVATGVVDVACVDLGDTHVGGSVDVAVSCQSSKQCVSFGYVYTEAFRSSPQWMY